MISQVWELKNRFINLQKEKKQQQILSDNYVTYTFNHDLLGEEVMLMSFPNRTMIEGYNLNGTDYIVEPVVTLETTEISEFILTNVGYCTTSFMSLADLTVNTRWRAKLPLSENDLMVLVTNLGAEYAMQPLSVADIPQMGLFYDYGNNEYGFPLEVLDLLLQEGSFNLGIFFAESTWDGSTIPTIDTEVAYVKISGGILNISVVPTSSTSELTIYCTDAFDNLGYCNKEIVRKIDGSGCNSVTSIGEEEFSDCSSLTNVIIPNSVTNIGEYAFWDCRGLTSITIPNSVISIGSSVFSCCTGLTSVTIGNSVTSIGYGAFQYCSGITSIEILNSVTSIGLAAFSKCTSLTNITIPNSVTSIGYEAFGYCSSLTNVTIGSGVTSIEERAFDGCSSLKEVHISDIAAWCNIDFEYRSNPLYYAHNLYLNGELVTELVIPDGVSEIKNWVFDGCTNLTNVIIGSSVTNIEHSAFSGCTGLTSITIPNSVTNIGNYAFYDCSSLTSIEIPNSVTSIGFAAFDGCTNLKELRIEDGGTILDLGYNSTNKGLFNDCPLETLYLGRDLSYSTSLSYGYSPFYYIKTLKSVTISNNVTSIGENAFRSCTSLTSITIPNGVTSIGESAFYECEGLTTVTIPNSVTNIGDYAFFACHGLTSIEIPSSVTSIGIYAFRNCDGLAAIIVKEGNTVYDSRESCNAIIGTKSNALITGCKNTVIPNSITSIELYAFGGCPGLTSITIPNGVTTIKHYAFAYCSDLTSITIGNGVISIGILAFNGCSKLTSITCLAETAPTIQSETFYDMSKTGTLKIPKGSDYSSWLEELGIGWTIEEIETL